MFLLHSGERAQEVKEFQSWGIDDEEIAEFVGPRGFEVYPSNWEAAQFFLKLQTQWNASMGGRTGLNYPGVESAARMSGIDLTPDLFGQLQVMELAILRDLVND